VKFKKEVLQELACMSMDDEISFENETYRVITNEMIDTSRWSIRHHLIFEYQDKFYESSYSTGATEYQDEGPYEYDDNEIECYEVEPYQTTITKYKRIV